MDHKYCLLDGKQVEDGVNILGKTVMDSLVQTNSALGGVDLCDIHTVLSLADLNLTRLAAFRALNTNPGSRDQALEMIAGVTLRNILGPDLLVQTKLNLSIQIPGDGSSQLDLHTDCWSGDTPFQVNLWIPLTRCFSTNSMFLLSEAKSLQCLHLLNRNPLLDRKSLWEYVDSDDYLTLNKGQVIIFNPALIHGNTPNTTNMTRISIKVRFKGLFSPDASTEHISRSAGPYYRPFSMSSWTRFALRIDRINQQRL
jgi:sporadic carbohydrate cluster 2OG-Fe(II) oxygenase